jgi:hypothetical protein
MLPYRAFVEFGISQTQPGKQTKIFRPQVAGDRLGWIHFPKAVTLFVLLYSIVAKYDNVAKSSNIIF